MMKNLNISFFPGQANTVTDDEDEDDNDRSEITIPKKGFILLFFLH